MKYRKKPVEVEARKWDGGDYEWLNEFCGLNWGRADAQDMPNYEAKENVVVWNTMERQWLHLPVGYWLIRGIMGELYPCEPDIFSLTYETL